MEMAVSKRPTSSCLFSRFWQSPHCTFASNSVVLCCSVSHSYFSCDTLFLFSLCFPSHIVGSNFLLCPFTLHCFTLSLHSHFSFPLFFLFLFVPLPSRLNNMLFILPPTFLFITKHKDGSLWCVCFHMDMSTDYAPRRWVRFVHS